MTIIHKKCNAPVKSSGKGDWGICTKCGERVDHLIIGGMKGGSLYPKFSDDVVVIYD